MQWQYVRRIQECMRVKKKGKKQHKEDFREMTVVIRVRSFKKLPCNPEAMRRSRVKIGMSIIHLACTTKEKFARARTCRLYTRSGYFHVDARVSREIGARVSEWEREKKHRNEVVVVDARG